MFRQGFSCPALLINKISFYPYRTITYFVSFSKLFRFLRFHRSARPRSLATTSGVSFDFLSSGYLDVSIPQVRFVTLCIQVKITLKVLGCPIQTFPDQSLFSAPRNFSQSITSFIASYCQGIHQMPFSYLILLCVCEILKNHIHLVGLLLSPTRLKVFTLNSLFFLSTRLEYIAILSCKYF